MISPQKDAKHEERRTEILFQKGIEATAELLEKYEIESLVHLASFDNLTCVEHDITLENINEFRDRMKRCQIACMDSSIRSRVYAVARRKKNEKPIKFSIEIIFTGIQQRFQKTCEDPGVRGLWAYGLGCIPDFNGIYLGRPDETHSKNEDDYIYRDSEKTFRIILQVALLLRSNDIMFSISTAIKRTTSISSLELLHIVKKELPKEYTVLYNECKSIA